MHTSLRSAVGLAWYGFCLSLFLVVGKWQGVVKIKMWFTAGGAIEFGQAMLRAGQLGMLNRLVMIFYETSQ